MTVFQFLVVRFKYYNRRGLLQNTCSVINGSQTLGSSYNFLVKFWWLDRDLDAFSAPHLIRLAALLEIQHNPQSADNS